MSDFNRSDGRTFDALRSVSFTRNFTRYAEGSVLVCFGETKVLCNASVEERVPPFMRGQGKGWVTAEYAMLPGSTPDRKRRGTDGRSTEIQRLIARSLRAGVNLEKMPGLLVTCDCDVLYADGGTRTASITGAYVALAQALKVARDKGLIQKNPLLGSVAAVSVGIVEDKAYLDLDYPLDSRAQVDMNVVMNHKGQYIEVQGTGEEGVFDRDQLDTLLDLAGKGIRQLAKVQRQALT
ncbi:MAG: ribonuclease PH [Geopsychrobacter sp.]|nr:ribonuclease PH [Geopsychrobacter sp.]